MKKKNVINLIKYHVEKNEPGFREEAYLIANSFQRMGDTQLAEYIMALLSNTNVFSPQDDFYKSEVLEIIEDSSSKLPLPEAIQKDLMGILNAINYNAGINKFLFQGAPGTGKTESVKHIARILSRKLYSVNFSNIIDSKLGQTQKNIGQLFWEIKNNLPAKRVIILFDELDALALDRTSSNDLREMGRATSTLLKELDSVSPNITIIATTNLYKHIDKALLRRFDAVIDFNRYNLDDLQDVAETITSDFLLKFKFAKKSTRFLRKIISVMEPMLMPGDLKNAIKISFAFSDAENPLNYLKKLYEKICPNLSIPKLITSGFTVREIELLTGVSKSQISRIANQHEHTNE